jgi:hypothetical protein
MSINYYDKNIYSLFHPASLYIIENVKKLQCQRTTDEIYAQRENYYVNNFWKCRKGKFCRFFIINKFLLVRGVYSINKHSITCMNNEWPWSTVSIAKMSNGTKRCGNTLVPSFRTPRRRGSIIKIKWSAFDPQQTIPSLLSRSAVWKLATCTAKAPFLCCAVRRYCLVARQSKKLTLTIRWTVPSLCSAHNKIAK